MNKSKNRIEDLRKFMKKHGKEPTRTTEATLSSWLRHQRWKWRNGDLQKHKIKALKELGIKPDKRLEQATWMDGYKEFKEYVKKTRKPHIPQGKNCPNKRLGHWEHNTRKLYLKGELSDKQIRLLDNLGFYWNVTDANFGSKLEKLKRYHKKTGRWTPSTASRYKDLYDWISRIRYNRRQNKLKKRYIDALNKIGFDWESPTQKVRKAREAMDQVDRKAAVRRLRGNVKA